MRAGDPVVPVTRLSRRVLCATFLRSFLIQGSWNYRTLIGGGFGFALLPVLQLIHGRDRDRLSAAIERHMGLFNSHPYLASLALGAVASLEAQGESAVVVERFKTALRGSLGTLGDRLIWVGWRPVCLLAALVLLLAGAPWWAAVIGFLLTYNAGHLTLRLWGFNLGLRHPRNIGERLRRSALDPLQRWLMNAGVFLVGLALPLVIAGAPLREWVGAAGKTVEIWWWVVGGLSAAIGVWLGGRARNIVALALAGFTIVGLILGLIK